MSPMSRWQLEMSVCSMVSSEWGEGGGYEVGEEYIHQVSYV